MEYFKNAISHNGQRCDIFYETTDTFEQIPDAAVLKVHGVCFCEGKLLLVNHLQWNVWGIPGGTINPGETPLQTLRRELVEETNCEIVSQAPLSYQKVISAAGDTHFRLHYLCIVRPKGHFRSDPAGSVHKIAWIDPQMYAEYVEPKQARLAVIRDGVKAYSVHHDIYSSR